VGDALGAPAYVLDRERDAGRVILREPAKMLDFTRYRGADLNADLRGRDFTINALALPAAGQYRTAILDPTNGQEDLKRRIVRLTHELAIEDDPVRALRAIRLANELNFKLAPDAARAIDSSAGLLGSVSVERMRDELVKLFGLPHPARAVENLIELGLLPEVLPEIGSLSGVKQTTPHYQDVLAHTMSVLSWLANVLNFFFDRSNVKSSNVIDEPQSALFLQINAALAPFRTNLEEHLSRKLDGGINGRQILFLGALFHDVGKSETQAIEPDGRIQFLDHENVGAQITSSRLRNLAMSNEAIRDVTAIVSGHMRPLHLSISDHLSRRAIYRFYRHTGAMGLDICLLSLADYLAIYQGMDDNTHWQKQLGVVGKLIGEYCQQYNQTVRPHPILRGHELMEALNLDPGPDVGRLLSIIEEAQASGEIETREQALSLARQALRN
jgi:putative nucleotidyltransferase with HDIG domain